MDLKKIRYTSAAFFGALAVVMMLIVGVWLLYQVRSIDLGGLPPEYSAQFATLSPMNLLVQMPLIYGVIIFLLTLLSIFIYNIVAKKFPIGWEVKK